jgi:hypothetical protein
MLGALTKPSDESVLKVKLLVCCIFSVSKPVVRMAECPPYMYILIYNIVNENLIVFKKMNHSFPSIS